MKMSEVYDYDREDWTICPFGSGCEPCITTCMLMRYDYGEPVCSFHVIAEELKDITSALREVVDR